ncbi:hypothetical protein [uncultured Photobacterium sp.]|uniref:hypothetical protein n=1 Tax=uncultured Photobacterium sp. TaxID=173973 RepID=UPI002627CC85|nr:hypothetical protein [uncultured Photobacterium sp.]
MSDLVVDVELRLANQGQSVTRIVSVKDTAGTDWYASFIVFCQQNSLPLTVPEEVQNATVAFAEAYKTQLP